MPTMPLKSVLLLTLLSLSARALGGPATATDEKINSELMALNKRTDDFLGSDEVAILEDENSAEKNAFSHRDEDMESESGNNDLSWTQKLRNDVELIESAEDEDENSEIEERFKGDGLHMDTDTFKTEDIEVSSKLTTNPASTHLVLSISLVFVALISIGVYAALVIWRSQLEQRYGMRELLVISEDDISTDTRTYV